MSNEQFLEEERSARDSQIEDRTSPEMEEKSLGDPFETLNEIREETGQISELTAEENMLVREFFAALHKIMKPFAQTLPISTALLPKEWGTVSHASLDLTGQLLILYPDGRMRPINLEEQRHRELLLKITHDIIPKLKRLVTLHRQNIESRVKFMSFVTKELQNTAKAFSSDASKQSTI
jgi:hypothetical protein